MMTQREIDAINLMSWGCLVRAAARLMAERNLTIRQTCALIRSVMHRMADQQGIELPGDVYGAAADLAELEGLTTPAVFAELLIEQGNKAVADAAAMKRENEPTNEKGLDQWQP